MQIFIVLSISVLLYILLKDTKSIEKYKDYRPKHPNINLSKYRYNRFHRKDNNKYINRYRNSNISPYYNSYYSYDGIYTYDYPLYWTYYLRSPIVIYNNIEKTEAEAETEAETEAEAEVEVEVEPENQHSSKHV